MFQNFPPATRPLASDRCEWSRKDDAVSVCGLDERLECVPDQGGSGWSGASLLPSWHWWDSGIGLTWPLLLQVHRKYTGEDFDEDLRTVLRRSGCKNEKIAFIMDESNVLDSGFLERMNTLLANGEVSK